MIELGSAIKEYKDKNNLTYTQIEKLTGIDRTILNRYSNFLIKNIPKENAIKLTKLMNLNIEDVNYKGKRSRRKNRTTSNELLEEIESFMKNKSIKIETKKNMFNEIKKIFSKELIDFLKSNETKEEELLLSL